MDTERVRGWGPFTGRQLTTIMCVGIVTILFPVGAWAITTTNTYISDAHTHVSAKVSAAGQLATVATVSGAVTAPVASPKDLFNGVAKGTGPMPVPAASPASGKALVVTSITLNYTTVTVVGGIVKFEVSTNNATCGTFGLPLLEDTPLTRGMRHVTLAAGLVVPAGRALCVTNSDPGNIVADVFVDGYLVPAASAPAGS